LFFLVHVSSPLVPPGGNIPNPLRNWEEAHFPPEIMRIIDQCNYTEPSPIQRAALPIGLINRDCVGIAETGTPCFFTHLVLHSN
jgi:superfamily II DNA/RNA helicase